MVLIEKGCKMANGGRIVTDPKVACSLPGHTFVRVNQNTTLLSGKFKTQLVDRCWVQCTRSSHADSGGAYGSAVFGGKGVMSMGKFVHFS